jgi:hypothetical protein
MTNEQMIQVIKKIFVDNELESIHTADVEAKSYPTFKETETHCHFIERFYPDSVEIAIWNKETKDDDAYYDVPWVGLDGETVQEIYDLLKFLM